MPSNDNTNQSGDRLDRFLIAGPAAEAPRNVAGIDAFLAAPPLPAEPTPPAPAATPQAVVVAPRPPHSRRSRDDRPASIPQRGDRRGRLADPQIPPARACRSPSGRERVRRSRPLVDRAADLHLPERRRSGLELDARLGFRGWGRAGQGGCRPLGLGREPDRRPDARRSLGAALGRSAAKPRPRRPAEFGSVRSLVVGRVGASTTRDLVAVRFVGPRLSTPAEGRERFRGARRCSIFDRIRRARPTRKPTVAGRHAT